MHRLPKALTVAPARAARNLKSPGPDNGSAAVAADLGSFTAPSTATGEQVAKQLGQAILQGRYAPGERVGEQVVAAQTVTQANPPQGPSR